MWPIKQSLFTASLVLLTVVGSRSASAAEPQAENSSPININASSAQDPTSAVPTSAPVSTTRLQASDEETPTASAPRQTSVKSGPVMLNLRLGGATALFVEIEGTKGVVNKPYGEAAFGAEFGYGMGQEQNVYLVLPLSVHYVPKTATTMVMAQIGVQFDIPIRSVPGLYLYPRITIGYSGAITGSESTHTGVVTPEFGIKYVLNGRVNLGIEPLAIPTLLDPLHGFALGMYRGTVSVGVNL